MKLHRTFIRFAATAIVVCGMAQHSPGYSQTMDTSRTIADKGIRVILVGDSTMATRTGYGDALCKRFVASTECINLARGGRSSKSFRVEGLWDNMLKILADNQASAASGSARKTWVLIQFGHNDQPGKAERSTDLATEFPVNMARYVDEVRAAGGDTVLVTPLTRRSFKDGVLQNDLRPWAEAVIRVARERSVPVIDLNAKSYAAVAAMGTAEADTLAEEPQPKMPLPEGVKSRFDYTHLGPKGASLFADMMASEIAAVVPAMARYLR